MMRTSLRRDGGSGGNSQSSSKNIIGRGHIMKKLRQSHRRSPSPENGAIPSIPATATTTSDFEIANMPENKIFPRTLHQWSVHHSARTHEWIATIMTASALSDPKPRHLQFPFITEREARRFCKAYSPPKKMHPGSSCMICSNDHDDQNITGMTNSNSSSGNTCSLQQQPLSLQQQPDAVQNSASTASAAPTSPSAAASSLTTTLVHSPNNNIANNSGNSSGHRHCRNCGIPVCDSCSARWGIRMVPKTYNSRLQPTSTVRVCRSCDWLSNAFCLALLQGRHADVVQLVETSRNINLRTCFATIHGEALFPVHACVLGGNMETLQWLVETQGCPLSVKKDPKTKRPLSVQTSAGRTLLDLAMKGRGSPKLEMLIFLVKQGLSIYDVQDDKLAPQTLEAILRAGFPNPNAAANNNMPGNIHVIMDTEDMNNNATRNANNSSHESVATLEDACALCCERPMDCVLVPCGHQICCTDCGQRVTACPLCKNQCTVLRVFRQ